MRQINLLAYFLILDEIGLPVQVKNQKQALWLRRRRQYLKSLSPAKCNALLAGDPVFALDPFIYEYVWSYDQPPLSPKLLNYFKHLPEVKEFENRWSSNMKKIGSLLMTT